MENAMAMISGTIYMHKHAHTDFKGHFCMQTYMTDVTQNTFMSAHTVKGFYALKKIF